MMTDRQRFDAVRAEWFLAASLLTCLAFAVFGPALLAGLESPLRLGAVLLWLCAVILGSSLSVVRHADALALRLGEPYGTLILTLAITFIEVMSISAVMLHGDNNPALTRDTLFAVIMIVLNGMVGLCLLLGGWRHKEQHYNLQGANAYLGVIIPLVVLSMLMPSFAQTTPGPTLSFVQQLFLVFTAVGLYVTFLGIQTGRHRTYFSDALPDDGAEPGGTKAGGARHALLMLAYLAPVVFLAEQLAHPIDYLIETLHAPAPIGGVIVAVLVATPEAITAVRASITNHMQRAINIFLGSILSTIGLTIPAMLVISGLTGREIVLGVEHTDIVMLLLTLAVSVVTFASGHTNVVQGAVHLIMFAAYLLFIVQN